MQRQIFTEEHDAFRETVRAFLAKEVLPYYEQWEQDGIVSREAWLAAGRAGLLGLAVPEEYGGGGSDDFRYSAVLAEEFTRAGAPDSRSACTTTSSAPTSPAWAPTSRSGAGSPASAPARPSPRSR